MIPRLARAGATLAALALALTGCAPTAADGPGAANPAPGGGTESTGSDDELATLRFTWWGNPTRTAATQEIVDQFMAEHPNIEVVTEPGEFSGYFDRLATQYAANDAPDVITMGGAYLPEYAGRGVLLDLDTVLEQFPIDGIDTAAVDNGRVGGTRYGATTGVNTLGVLVNTQLFADAGVQLPDDDSWTWDDYARIAQEISANSPDGIYGAAGGLTHDSLGLWGGQQGEQMYTEEGGLGLTEQTVTDYFQYSLDLVRAGGAPPATIITEQVNAPIEQTLLATNRAAMALTWSNYLTPATEASGNELALLKPPGESVNVPGSFLQSSQFFVINANTEHPEAAALLIDHLLNSPEAGRIVLNDRGVPTNAEVREAIASELPETAQAEVTYIDRVAAMDLQPVFIGPPGSTQVSDITNRAMASVLFEQLTPQQAAQQWIRETETAIA